LIDYEQFTVNTNSSTSPPPPPAPQQKEISLPKRSQSTVNKINSKSKLILPDKMIYVHIKTLNEGQSFVRNEILFILFLLQTNKKTLQFLIRV